MENLIWKHRKDINLTQEQLSEILGVSRQTINSLEVGRYKPSLILAHKIAQLFNCQIEEIFIFQGDENI